MKIALVGTRGIPASHGGFETCVEEVGARLVNKGHQVYVYSKIDPSNAGLKSYRGMRIIRIPRIPVQGLETLFSTVLSVIHSLFFKFDLHMVFNGANSPALVIYKLLGKKFALNTDGLEWQREKWGKVGRNYYKLSERISVMVAKNLVSDSKGIQNYYLEKYKAPSTMIAYGAGVPPDYSQKQVDSVLKEFRVKKFKYVLQVTRFEPENNPLLTIEGFKLLGREDLSCLVIGGAPYNTPYLQQMISQAGQTSNIYLPGYVYQKECLDILWKHSLCYVHGNSVGGTNPALLQAMAAGRPVLALDCIFNREVLGDGGYYFSRAPRSIFGELKSVVDNISKAELKAAEAVERIRRFYNWELIAEQYEKLFSKLVYDK